MLFLLEMQKQLPCFFEDIPYDEKFYEERLKGYTDDMVTYDCEYDRRKWLNSNYEYMSVIEG